MTTDTKALIDEARELANYRDAPHVIVSTSLLRRLAAALEEATPPEGWDWVKAVHDNGSEVERYSAKSWDAFSWRENRIKGPFPTARSAMEALEKGEISP